MSAAPAFPAGLPRQRLRLVVSSGLAGSAVLMALRALAGHQPTEVEVLFVEDVDLLGLAVLPFSREVGVASGLARSLARPELEQALRAAARRAERAVRRMADEHRFACVFEIRRGRPGDEAVREAETDDVVLLQPRRPVATRTGGGPAPTRRILMSASADSAQAQRVLQAARVLAGPAPGRPAPVRSVDAPGAGEGAWIAADLASRSTHLVPPAPAQPRQGPALLRLAPGPGDALVLPMGLALTPGPGDLLVLPMGLALTPPGTLRQWLDTLRCPVALVR